MSDVLEEQNLTEQIARGVAQRAARDGKVAWHAENGTCRIVHPFFPQLDTAQFRTNTNQIGEAIAPANPLGIAKFTRRSIQFHNIACVVRNQQTIGNILQHGLLCQGKHAVKMPALEDPRHQEPR